MSTTNKAQAAAEVVRIAEEFRASSAFSNPTYHDRLSRELYYAIEAYNAAPEQAAPQAPGGLHRKANDLVLALVEWKHQAITRAEKDEAWEHVDECRHALAEYLEARQAPQASAEPTLQQVEDWIEDNQNDMDPCDVTICRSMMRRAIAALRQQAGGGT